MLLLLLAIVTSWISPFYSALEIIELKPSAQNKNKYEDNESPCCKPLVEEKVILTFRLLKLNS